jgi:hypothetical protein
MIAIVADTTTFLENGRAAERQVDMKRLTFLFLLAAITLGHALSAMAHLHPQLQRFVQRDSWGYVGDKSLY